MSLYEPAEVSLGREVHHNIQGGCLLIVEGVSVPDNIRMVYGSQNPNLVEGVVPLFLAEFGHFDLNR